LDLQGRIVSNCPSLVRKQRLEVWSFEFVSVFEIGILNLLIHI
jgi:hypothetical protein